MTAHSDLPPLKPSFSRFYIIRHGQTEWNLEKRIQGQLDSNLSEKGEEQAKGIAKKLLGVDFSTVYSSDLGRAKQTANILIMEKKVVLKTTALLRERYMGILQGKTRQEMSQKLIDLLDQLDQLYKLKQKNPNIKIEDWQKVASRTLRFIRQAAVAHDGENVLVVTHSGNIRALLKKLKFHDLEKLYHLAVENLGYFVLDSDGVDFFVKQLNGIYKKDL
jgi:broad specificity phosphatase PhoE